MPPVASSRPTDFDAMVGAWTVGHRRLRERFVGCRTWDEFIGTSTTRWILDGWGVVEDNRIDLPAGVYSGCALRTFDATTRSWAIWWIDGRNPHHIDVPVLGSFTDGIGRFFAHDIIDGTPTEIRFTWSGIGTIAPRWEQAFRADGSTTWEINWTMDFVRSVAPSASAGSPFD